MLESITATASERPTSRSARGRWLIARLQTETLRLFHFSYLANRLPDVVAASRDLKLQADYQKARAHVFAQLKSRVLENSDKAYEKLLEDPEHAPYILMLTLTPFFYLAIFFAVNIWLT